MIKIKIVSTFTESPSFNVRLLVGESTIFYNSERLQGNSRLREVGKILDIHELRVGEIEMEITNEQYAKICEVERA